MDVGKDILNRTNFNSNTKFGEEYNKNLWRARVKRDKAVALVPEWEELRDLASRIRHYDLSNLDYYLEQFEKKAVENGAVVHWAKDGNEHNDILYKILESHGIKDVVKINSLLLNECNTVEYLKTRGIEVTETDIGMSIQLLNTEPVTHVSTPFIKKSYEEIAAHLAAKVGSDPEERDPKVLTDILRKNMRPYFLKAGAGLSTPNFAIAETGTLAYFNNEGNTDLGTLLPPVHIVSIGIDKILSRAEDLAVFVRLFARSALGTPATQYVSHYTTPPPERIYHIILVDDDRSKRLGMSGFRNTLNCIHCGACLNTCPVYRRMGKVISYKAPIFRVLTPKFELNENNELPFYSTLCGSCSAVCPVKIDITEQIQLWREEAVKTGNFPSARRKILIAAGRLIGKPNIYHTIENVLDKMFPIIPDFIARKRFKPWLKNKKYNTGTTPKQTFREWYEKNRKGDNV